MKNYFDFTLKGKKLLPYWILFMAVFYAPYICIAMKIKEYTYDFAHKSMYLLLLYLLIIVCYMIFYFFIKLSIEGISYRQKNIVFNSSFRKFLGVYLTGVLLTIITLGIYYAWFIKSIYKYFVNNSSYGDEGFSFQGKGGRLFVIMLLCLLLPFLIVTIILGALIFFSMPYLMPKLAFILYGLVFILMIPFTYFFYKWMVDVHFKGYHIKWQTALWPSLGRIALEIFLSVITAGIYSPLAMFRLYKYFTDRTIAEKGEEVRKFGYDIDHLNDFLYAWGQILLTIITIMVYYPWACCKICKRLLSKTFIE
jgi:uncharacterized membrane protein YjgN (DUF898 family)